MNDAIVKLMEAEQAFEDVYGENSPEYEELVNFINKLQAKELK